MGILFRYISRELYTTLFGILMVLLIIFMSNQFARYLHLAAGGHVTMSAVMQLMSLQIPFLLAYLVPLALYLSILVAFGRLYMDHEMTVMFAGGMSQARMLIVICSVAVVITLAVGGLMLWLEPFLDRQRVQIFYESAAEATVEKVMPKRFQTIGSNMVFYADEVERGALKMRDIFFAQRSKPKNDGVQSWTITIAKNAQESYQDDGRFMVFQQGFRYEGEPGMPDYQTVQYQEYGIRISQTLPTHNGWPSNASTLSLWPQRHNPKVAAELHWRMAMPVSTFILALLAFPLSRVNPRRGKFSQLIPAILLYIVYANLLFLGRNWLRKGLLDFDIGLWWVHGLMALIVVGLLMYRRINNAYS
jgi:lipopolysaccharide export system permease protein